MKVVIMDEPTKGVDVGAKARSMRSWEIWQRKAMRSS